MNTGTRFKKIFQCWSEDRISTQAAALAYYTIFSLTPILVICISIAAIVFGEEAAKGQIMGQINGLVGNDAALQIQELLAGANKPLNSWWARLFSILVLLFSASGVFSEIQSGLNMIWGVKADPHKAWWKVIKARFFSFIIVFGLAFLLLTALIISAFLTYFNKYFSYYLGHHSFINLLFSDLFSFTVVSLVFAMMFKILPDVHVKWSEVWFGALITSLLFSLGKMLIGLYLNHFHVASVFGAAGSLIIILIWAYYSSQIFFIGAEITKVFSLQKGKEVIPSRNAIFLPK